MMNHKSTYRLSRTWLVALVGAALFGNVFRAAALEVTAFGAVAGDGRSDTPAFLAAFRAAGTGEVQRVVIPKG